MSRNGLPASPRIGSSGIAIAWTSFIATILTPGTLAEMTLGWYRVSITRSRGHGKTREPVPIAKSCLSHVGRPANILSKRPSPRWDLPLRPSPSDSQGGRYQLIVTASFHVWSSYQAYLRVGIDTLRYLTHHAHVRTAPDDREGSDALLFRLMLPLGLIGVLFFIV